MKVWAIVQHFYYKLKCNSNVNEIYINNKLNINQMRIFDWK